MYPDLANAVNAAPGAGSGAWVFSVYTQLVASTPADFYPNIAHILLQAIPQTAGTKRFVYEVEFATGAAGSEVTFARFSDAVMAAITNVDVNDNINFGRSFPVGPTLIPSGARIAFRIRCELADTAVKMNVTTYLQGYDGPAPPGSDPTYPLDEHLGGASSPHLLATPTGSTLSLGGASFGIGYGSWVEVIASAAADLLVWGLEGYLSVGAANASRHVQFGIGAAGSEVPHALLGLPGKLAIGVGQYELRRPLLVRAGERLAVRSTGGVTAWNIQVLYEEL